MKTHTIRGAALNDMIFSVTLPDGMHYVWNVTKLARDAAAGRFGQPVPFQTADLPPAQWETWGDEDRKTVDWLKANPIALTQPVIGFTPPPEIDCHLGCFVDGQHRITAIQELGLPVFWTYVVPWEIEHEYRVTGFPEEITS